MPGLKKANRRIAKELRELKRDEREIDQGRKTLKNLDATEDDLKKDLKRLRKWQDHRRDSLREVNEELAGIEEGGIEDSEADEYAELQERREVLADKIDEGVATKQQLLERLDNIGEREKDARQRIDRFVDERKEDRKDLEIARKKRAKIKKQQAAKDQPSAHFTYAEFDCNDGTDLPEQAKPAVKDWCNRIGEPLRSKYGSVHVNSGFRHASYNAAIGGASNSVHIYNYPGRDCKAAAVDVSCGAGSAGDWYNFTAGKADGRGRYSTFHHADTRNRIGWPDTTWSG